MIEAAQCPMVSVILPVRNEGSSFLDTLEGILGQDYPADRMEVLVVDGMSDDDTPEVVRSVAARDPRVRLLENPGQIVPTAMNRGILEARGEIVVRIDGHTLVEPDYVRRCVEALGVSSADCVGGKMIPRGATFVGNLVALATSGPFGVGNAHFHYSDRPMFTDTVYMGSWPRKVLIDLRGFDEEMVRDQDDELNYRLRSRGGKVYLDPAIRSEYLPRGSLRRLWSQYFQYGYWKIRVFQKHPRMLRWRHFAPSLFVLVGGLTTLAALAVPLFGWVWLAGVALYVGAGWVAAFRTEFPGTGRWALPAVYFTIHGAYGSGFLLGLIRFLPLWFDRSRAASFSSAIPIDSTPGDPE